MNKDKEEESTKSVTDEKEQEFRRIINQYRREREESVKIGSILDFIFYAVMLSLLYYYAFYQYRLDKNWLW